MSALQAVFTHIAAPAIRARIAELEAIKSAAAAGDAHNADTVWACAVGELDELRARLAELERAS